MKQTVFRLVLLLSGLLILVIGVQTAFGQGTYNEAPMLAERVANGELPPVDERLPENPMVVEPFDQIGTYGGNLQYAGSFGDIVTFVGWDFLTRWEADMSGVYPNVVESYEINEDASVYTFHLRPGMRWSDGMPFTADDIVFAMNDILLNPEVNANPPSNLVFNGETVVVEKVDDYTVTFTFAGSYGLFPENLAWWPSWQFTYFPKHWLAPYHIDYDPDNVEAIMASAADYPELANVEITSWVNVFNVYAQNGFWAYLQNEIQHERPTLFPWIVSDFDADNGILNMERNPYYWKVDTAGNQLPYIDELTLTVFAEADEVKLLGLLSGQFDTTKDPPQEDYDLFLDGQFTSGLGVYDVPSDGAGLVSVTFNRTNADEQKSVIFGDLDFRIGVSHAINRQQIIAFVFNGIGTPRQIAPVESSPLYNEQLENQYIEFDPALANEYLDRVLPEKDAEGYRLMPDGNRLVVNFSVVDQFGLGFPQIAELVAEHLDAVGIQTTIEIVDDIVSLVNNNTVEATIYTGEGGSGISAILDPRWYVPINAESSMYATGWANWYIDPNDEFAVEPPEHIKAQFALYEQVLSTPDADERIRLMQEVLQIAADEFFTIGISSPPDRYWLISQDINNLPELCSMAGFPVCKGQRVHSNGTLKYPVSL